MVARAFDVHENFSFSQVATAPTPASSGTSLSVDSGEGSRFPDPATYGPYNVVIWPADQLPTTANAEIVRVTARSTDALTITRQQESTSARTVVVGDNIAMAITQKVIDDIEGGQATVATTDGVATVLATIAVAVDTTTMIEARVVARRTGGASGTAQDGAGYVITATFKNTAGVAALIGSVDQDRVMESQSGWDCTMDANGGNCRILATGATDNNVTWLVNYRVIAVSTS